MDRISKWLSDLIFHPDLKLKTDIKKTSARQIESYSRLKTKFSSRQDLRDNGLGEQDLTVQDLMDALNCYAQKSEITESSELRQINIVVKHVVGLSYPNLFQNIEDEDINLADWLDQPLDLKKIIPPNKDSYDLYHYPGGLSLTTKRDDQFKKTDRYLFRLNSNSLAGKHLGINKYFTELGVPFISSLHD